jgi:hypothetical protein
VRSDPREPEFVVKQKVAAGFALRRPTVLLNILYPDFVKSNHRLVLRSVGLPKTRSRRILRRFLKAKEAGLDAEMSPRGG